MKNKFPYFIIIIGLLVIVYPIASNLYSSYWENQNLQEADQLLNSENSSNREADLSQTVADSFSQMNQAFADEGSEEELNRENASGENASGEDEESAQGQTGAVEEISEEESTIEEEPGTEEASNENDSEPVNPAPQAAEEASGAEGTNAGQGDVIGRIEIPSINVNLPLLFGSDDRTLDRGAGQIIGTAKPGEIGNTGIAAHRANRDGRFFYRLDELGVGDEIIIRTPDGTFVYTVYATKIVDPTDLSVLNRNQTDKVVTLITCHPRYTADYRLIVHGKLSS